MQQRNSRPPHCQRLVRPTHPTCSEWLRCNDRSLQTTSGRTGTCKLWGHSVVYSQANPTAGGEHSGTRATNDQRHHDTHTTRCQVPARRMRQTMWKQDTEDIDPPTHAIHVVTSGTNGTRHSLGVLCTSTGADYVVGGGALCCTVAEY